jgi:hypothetical protein
MFLFHLKYENIFVSTIFFLKLCAIWVHVNLGVVNRFIICSVNVFTIVEKPIVRKFRFWNLMEKKNSLTIEEDFNIND